MRIYIFNQTRHDFIIVCMALTICLKKVVIYDCDRFDINQPVPKRHIEDRDSFKVI